MPHPDQKYIEALLNNDTALLKELYDKFLGRIKYMIIQNSGTETDAVDIFQDALLAIFDKAVAQPFELTCPFEAFLYFVCRNIWMNELDRRKSHKVINNRTDVLSNMGEDDFKLVEELTVQQARNDLMQEKLATLSKSCRQLLELNWSGKSLEEAAAELNVSYGYIRKKKSDCMARLVMSVRESSLFNSLKW